MTSDCNDPVTHFLLKRDVDHQASDTVLWLFKRIVYVVLKLTCIQHTLFRQKSALSNWHILSREAYFLARIEAKKSRSIKMCYMTAASFSLLVRKQEGVQSSVNFFTVALKLAQFLGGKGHQ